MDNRSELRVDLGLKAIQMSEVDWAEVMPRYHKAYHEWTITPLWLWFLVIGLGLISIESFPNPWSYIGVFLVGLSCWILGSRSSSDHERFQIGYEWGLEDGVCAGLGIPADEKNATLKKAHEWKVEYRMNTGEDLPKE